METTATVKPLVVAKKLALPTVLLFFCLSVVLGVGAGYGVSLVAGNSSDKTSEKAAGGEEKKGVGVFDKKRFPDTAEGKLTVGGIDGEGSYHLVRPGGDSQNVYLTSSTVDMSQYVGKSVKVWGQTFSGEKAGWLMDVGYLEVK